MAAKNKRTTRDTVSRASHHRDELIEEARSLMAAGRVREARAVEGRAGQVNQLLGAIESEPRPESDRDS
jgi:hypothetical protein